MGYLLSHGVRNPSVRMSLPMARASKKLSPVMTPKRSARDPNATDILPLPGAEEDPQTPTPTPSDLPKRISQPPSRARKQGGRQPRPHQNLDGTPLPSKRKGAAARAVVAVPVAAGRAAVISRRRELLGLVLLAAGVLCVMALWSYQPNDGPWALPRRPTHNWAGPVGAMMADGLVGLLGLGAHVAALGLLVMGGLCFRPRVLTPSMRQVGGGVLTLLSAAIISHLVFRNTGTLSFAPGGLLGAVCGDGLARFFSAPGTAVIAGAGFAAGIMLATDFSLAQLFRLVAVTADNMAEHWREWRETQRQKAQLKRQHQEEARAAMLAAADEMEAQRAAERTERAERRKVSARLKAELAVERETRQATDDAAMVLGNNTDPDHDTDVSMVVPQLSSAGGEAAAEVHAAPTEEDGEPAAEDAPRIVEFVANDPAPAEARALAVAAPADGRPKPFGHTFELPPLSLLDEEPEEDVQLDREALAENARVLERTFRDFAIEGRVREIRPGPVVTTYEFTLAPGIRVGKVANMANDLAMALEAMSVRIVAPIPGKNAVGIEIPNNRRQNVYLKGILGHPDFQKARSKLTLALGKDIEGRPYQADLARMPHVLVAGTTGSGKSVSVNGMILSILYRATPDDVRFLMIDPKMLELKLYEGIPHLLLPPVTDPKKAALALRWAVEEMERRYELLADFSVRDLQGFNRKMDHLREGMERKRQAAAEQQPRTGETNIPVQDVDEAGVVVEAEGHEDNSELDRKAIQKHNGVPERMPFIVVVVDEFADLMMVASKDVEMYVARLAQKARACGIHVLLATQRPSVDVITGVIKANFPTRMSFRVASMHDSKTIINTQGAERLLGNGDMLMIPPGTSDLMRVHGGFVSESEISRVVAFWKGQGKPQYNEAILKAPEGDAEGGTGGGDDEPYDEFFDRAVEIVARTRKVSISEIQRKLGVGYNRAAKMVERMEKDGMIGPTQGANKPREVFVRGPDDV